MLSRKEHITVACERAHESRTKKKKISTQFQFAKHRVAMSECLTNLINEKKYLRMSLSFDSVYVNYGRLKLS